MARDYSRRPTSVWRDPDFTSLTMRAQWTYDMFTSQPDISPAGTLPLTLRRWTRHSADLTDDVLLSAIDELERRHFVVVDRDTEELLVRTFIKWDGGYGPGNNRLKAILSSAKAAASPKIRSVLAFELARLDVPNDLPDPPRDARELPSEGASEGPNEGASEGGSEGTRVVVTTTKPVSNPQPTTRNTSKIARDRRPDVMEICELLADRIEANGSKRPTISQGWVDAARLMLDRDGRSVSDIKRLIRWSQDDEFWRSNILSMPKFREQFDKLRLQAERVTKSHGDERDGWQYGVFG